MIIAVFCSVPGIHERPKEMAREKIDEYVQASSRLDAHLLQQMIDREDLVLHKWRSSILLLPVRSSALHIEHHFTSLGVSSLKFKT